MTIVQASRLAAGIACLAEVSDHAASGALLVHLQSENREAAIDKLRSLSEAVGYKVAQIGIDTRPSWSTILADTAVPTMLIVSCDASSDRGLAKDAVRQCLALPGVVLAFVMTLNGDWSEDPFIDSVCDAVMEMRACGSGRESVEIVDLD